MFFFSGRRTCSADHYDDYRLMVIRSADGLGARFLVQFQHSRRTELPVAADAPNFPNFA
jgi:hypothetical protein